MSEQTTDVKVSLTRRTASCVAAAISLTVFGAGCASGPSPAGTEAGVTRSRQGAGSPTTDGVPRTEGANQAGAAPAPVAAETTGSSGTAPVQKAVPIPPVAGPARSTMPRSTVPSPRADPPPPGPEATEQHLAEIDASLAEVDRQLTTANDEMNTTEGDPNQ